MIFSNLLCKRGSLVQQDVGKCKLIGAPQAPKIPFFDMLGEKFRNSTKKNGGPETNEESTREGDS